MDSFVFFFLLLRGRLRFDDRFDSGVLLDSTEVPARLVEGFLLRGRLRLDDRIHSGVLVDSTEVPAHHVEGFSPAYSVPGVIVTCTVNEERNEQLNRKQIKQFLS